MKSRLSNELKLIIAKSDYENNKWLPFWIHEKDTANIMEYLLHSRYQELSDLCALSFDDLKKTGMLLAYLHDIGKITPLFQAKILESLPGRRTIFEHYGVKIPEYSKFILNYSSNSCSRCLAPLNYSIFCTFNISLNK